ncbi:hypothetical protein FNH22_12230 [Fulvivirga sp. M361]|uniref:hypothetical protein n=1 Tax=Fulvivirga sp. M361 TaxID=2594266 RepID=UPI00117B4131|nr:hypothetical protein [Fulvivirga sp. M361]TRX58641.1 hypothetical protein FNH22_12230 [Fulvivirga sp. M361]
MYESFDDMPENARVWVYQSNRKLNEQELASIDQAANQFVDSWEAHGAPLRASYKLLHDQFLIILVDESFNSASGCSIDASVHFIQKIEKDLDLNFFDRSKVAFIYKNEVFLESLNDLKLKVSEGVIDENTLTFNNLIQYKKELEQAWLLPAGKTWLGRYFN